MLKNYLLVAFRNISRNKIFSFINIFGLALGIYVCIIIGLYVIDDLSFDRYHTNAERIYRVVSFDNTRDWVSAVTSGPMMLKIEEDIPEIEASTRISPAFFRLQPGTIDPASDSLAIFRPGIITGPGFFRVFDFKILKGEKEHPFEDPNGIYISQNVVDAIFPDENPVGKPINIRSNDQAYVAGIIETPPRTSHMQFDVVQFMDIDRNPVWWDSWENLALSGYVLLHKGADPKIVEQKIIASSREGGFSEVFTPQLQPLLDMHLGSQDIRYDAFNQFKNSKSVIYSLIFIAILVIFVASINFVNLSIARSVKRAREVGMRKVVGANRRQLSTQFILESIVLTLLAMIIAACAAEMSLPYLQGFLNKSLTLDFLHHPTIIVLLLLIGIILGLASGFYPAVVLSSFKPTKVFRAKFTKKRKGIGLRKILLLGQFSISIGLIAGVLIVLQQIRFLQHRDYGYNREHVVVIPARDEHLSLSTDIFRDRVTQIPGVISFGRSSLLPGRTLPTTEVSFDFRKEGESNMFEHFQVDYDFIPTLKINMIKGRNFSRKYSSDTLAVLINETAYRMSGWKDLEGKKIINRGASMIDEPFQVIGVFNDINFGTVNRPVEPMLLQLNPAVAGLALIRLESGDNEVTQQEIEDVYNELYPDRQYQSFSFDEILSFQLNGDRGFAINIAIFAGLAIIIACLGLFGLASYSIEVRQKELAIRKVLGSSVMQIIYLLSKEFSQWVIYANVIAWPVAFLMMQKWMESFAYRAPFSIIPFILAGIAALFISFLTISLRMITVVRSNPVETLKYE